MNEKLKTFLKTIGKITFTFCFITFILVPLTSILRNKKENLKQVFIVKEEPKKEPIKVIDKFLPIDIIKPKAKRNKKQIFLSNLDKLLKGFSICLLTVFFAFVLFYYLGPLVVFIDHYIALKKLYELRNKENKIKLFTYKIKKGIKRKNAFDLLTTKEKEKELKKIIRLKLGITTIKKPIKKINFIDLYLNIIKKIQSTYNNEFIETIKTKNKNKIKGLFNLLFLLIKKDPRYSFFNKLKTIKNNQLVLYKNLKMPEVPEKDNIIHDVQKNINQISLIKTNPQGEKKEIPFFDTQSIHSEISIDEAERNLLLEYEQNKEFLENFQIVTTTTYKRNPQDEHLEKERTKQIFVNLKKDQQDYYIQQAELIIKVLKMPLLKFKILVLRDIVRTLAFPIFTYPINNNREGWLNGSVGSIGSHFIDTGKDNNNYYDLKNTNKRESLNFFDLKNSTEEELKKEGYIKFENKNLLLEKKTTKDKIKAKLNELTSKKPTKEEKQEQEKLEEYLKLAEPEKIKKQKERELNEKKLNIVKIKNIIKETLKNARKLGMKNLFGDETKEEKELKNKAEELTKKQKVLEKELQQEEEQNKQKEQKEIEHQQIISKQQLLNKICRFQKGAITRIKKVMSDEIKEVDLTTFKKSSSSIIANLAKDIVIQVPQTTKIITKTIITKEKPGSNILEKGVRKASKKNN